jgi:hypothetical protein
VLLVHQVGDAMPIGRSGGAGAVIVPSFEILEDVALQGGVRVLVC